MNRGDAMAGSLVLRWMLTAAFALAGAYCTVQCLTAVSARRRVDPPALTANVAHVAMSAVMIGMVWWAPSWRVVTWEMALFALAGGWFVVRIVAMRQSAACDARTLASHGPAHSTIACAHHAAAMAAMIWMLTTMAERHGMVGMPSHAATLPASRPVTATVLGVYFAIAAALWFAGVRRRRAPGSAGSRAASRLRYSSAGSRAASRLRYSSAGSRAASRLRYSSAAHALMSAAMGTAFLALAW